MKKTWNEPKLEVLNISSTEHVEQVGPDYDFVTYNYVTGEIEDYGVLASGQTQANGAGIPGVNKK